MKDYNKMHNRSKSTISDERIITTPVYEEISPKPLTAKVTATKLNLRESMNKDSKILYVLNKDTVLTIFPSKNIDCQWIYVEVFDICGYVMKDFIEEVEELDFHE